MRRRELEELVDETDVLADVNIKDLAKEAKLGWLKTLLITAVWPILKELLLKKINPKIVEIIDKVIQSV